MPVTHQIDDLVLDLTFRSATGARRTVDDIQSWLEHELLPELDEILTRYSPARETLRLGTIALDCGTLTRNNYKQAIRKRLFDELERVVPPQLLALNPEISFALNNGAAPDDTAVHQLLGFLESGQLPWHRLQSGDELHGQLFDRIATHPQLGRLLQPALRSGPALRRLVRQFSEARLNKILANLAPGLLPLAIALQDLFDLGELTRRIGRAARSAIHEAQWSGLLGMGFARENAVPDAAVLTNLLRNWLAAADSYPDALVAALVPPVTSSGWADAGPTHRTLGEAVLRLADAARERVTVPSATNASHAALPAQAGVTHVQTVTAGESADRYAASAADPVARALLSPDTQRTSPDTPREANEVRMLGAQTSTSRATPASPDALTANAKTPQSPGAQTALEQTAFDRDSVQPAAAQTAANERRAPVTVARAATGIAGIATDSPHARDTSREQEAPADGHAPSAVVDAQRFVLDAMPRANVDARTGEASVSAETPRVRQDASAPADIVHRLREALDAHDVRFLVLHWDTLRQALQHDRIANEIGERMRAADFRARFIAHAPDFLLLDMLAPLQPAAAAALKALPGSTAPALWRWLQAISAQRATTPPPPRRSRTRRDARASDTRTPVATRDVASPAAQAPDISPMPAQFRQELWFALFSGSLIQPQEPWRLDTFVTRLLGAAAPRLLAEAPTLQLRWLAALAVDAGGAANAEAQQVRKTVRDGAATPDGDAQPGATRTQSNEMIAALLPTLPQGRSRRAQADALRKARRTRSDLLQTLLARSPGDAAPTFTSAELAALVAELIEHDDSLTSTQHLNGVAAVLERALRVQTPHLYLQRALQLLLDGSERDAAKLIDVAEEVAEGAAEGAAESAADAAAVAWRSTPSVESSARDDSGSRMDTTPLTAAQTTINETTEAEAVAAVVARLRTQPATLNAVNADTSGWQRLLLQYLRTETAIGAGLAETIAGAVAARAHAAQEPSRIYRIALDNLLRGRRPLAGIALSSAQPRDSAPRPTSAARPPVHTDAPQGLAGHSRATIATAVPAHLQDATNTQVSAAADTPHSSDVRATAAHAEAPRARAPGAQRQVASLSTSDRAETIDVSAPDSPPEAVGTSDATPARDVTAADASAVEDETSTPIRLDALPADALPELCIALGTGSVLPVRVHGTEGAWLALLEVYTAEVLGQDPSIRNDLLAAIQQHAQRAAQREHYYRNVLACLVAQVPLDLEELESADMPQALTQAAEHTSTQAPGAADALPPHAAEIEAGTSDAAAIEAPAPRNATAGVAQASAATNDAMPSQDAHAGAGQRSIATESIRRDTTTDATPLDATTEAVRRDTPADATRSETATVTEKPAPVAGTTSHEATSEAAERRPASDTALHETATEAAELKATSDTASRGKSAEAAKPRPASETALRETAAEPARRTTVTQTGKVQEAPGEAVAQHDAQATDTPDAQWPGTSPRAQHEPGKERARATGETGSANVHASQPEASSTPTYTPDPGRERNPWLVTATLLARDTLPDDERNELAHVLDTVLAETQPVRLRGWLKLLGDTRLHRGWTVHVARVQLVRLIRHAAGALPDAPRDRLHALDSTDAPLRVATELYAAFNATRRYSAVGQARSAAMSTAQDAATAPTPPVTRAVERARGTTDTQVRDDNPALDARHAAEDERAWHDKRDTNSKHVSGSKRDVEDIREPDTTRPAASPNTDIDAIEALHEAALDLARALAEPHVSGAAQVQLKRITDAILNQRDATLLREWRKVFTSARLQQGLVRHLPAHVLERLLRQLAPDVWPIHDASSSLVVQALGLLVPDARSHAIEQAKWLFLFERAFAAGAPRADADLLTELAQVLAVAAGLDDGTRLLQLVERRRLALSTRAQQTQASAAQGADTLTFPGYDQEDTAPDADLARDVHLDNAGLVLVAPFIPRLFSMLNVTANGNFPDHAAAERGVHLLQFLVTGQEFTPEYRLLLNKVMCGIIPGFPVCAGIDVSPQEKDAIEQLLQSIIQHWKILGGTSIAGLRQTFLQREGWLRQDENGWHVEVKPGSFDMLLDQLPWSYSLIKFTWMDKPMHVTWRNKQTQ